MSQFLLVVFTNPVEGREDEFNEWYSRVHLRDVLGVDGFVSAQRFRLCDTQLLPRQAQPHRYMAIYEVEAEEPDPVLDALRAGITNGSIPLHESLDRSTLVARLFSPISERSKAIRGS